MMFSHLPDSSKVWIFGAERTLAEEEQASLLANLAAFLAGWRSHGRPVTGEATVTEDRFLLVAAHVDDGFNAGVSGCGIDAMVAEVEDAGERLGLRWLDGLQVFYRDVSGGVRALPRSAFREQVRQGAIGVDTRVFDTTVSELGLLRAFGLERRAGDSWHARVFRLPHPSVVG